MILISVTTTCLLMGKLTTEMLLVLLATLATGVLGLIDDATSVTHGRSLGLTPHAKMIGLTLICVTFCLLAVNWCGVAPVVLFPGGLPLTSVCSPPRSTWWRAVCYPWLYVIFTWLLIAGMSNAVNLTDGLDGLAGGTSMIAMLIMGAIAFLHGDANLVVFRYGLCRRLPGLFVVQLLPGEHFYGRHRLACPGHGLRLPGDYD